ncbi:hypothetical protein O3M35_011205 [Rhynocoris fuscipes]|uniref:Uncharacterized protein n=1 Tax=Rhynocoris fuscipes TaxID=488301 RepID=A0AAW1CU87_9HEMI
MYGTGERYWCTVCNYKSYKNRHHLKRHQKYECLKEPQFCCPYCDYRTKQKYLIEAAQMEVKYNAILYNLLEGKCKNSLMLTKSAYQAKIDKVKESKSKVTQKLPDDYQRLRRYDVIQLDDGTERLIVPKKGDEPMKLYVHIDEVFHILHRTHITIGHAGRNRMAEALCDNYRNITREMIKVYLALCRVCQTKRYSNDV